MAVAESLEKEPVKKFIDTLKLSETAGDTLNDVEVEAVLNSLSNMVVEVEAEKLTNTLVAVKA